MTNPRKSIRATPLAGAILLLAGATAPAAASLQQDIGRIVSGYREGTAADVGVHVVDLRDGKTLCGIASETPLIPASNQKILTSAVVVARLGADFAFRTILARRGDDLVVLGDGDPTPGDARIAAELKRSRTAVMDEWAGALRKRGIRRIDGDLVLRTGLFRGPFVHPDWPRRQLRRWYAAGAAALNFNDNCLDIGFEVRAGSVRAVVWPVSRFMEVLSRVRPGRRHLWSCRLDETGLRVELIGTVTRTTPDPLPVATTNPPMLFGAVLAERLLAGGIELRGGIRIDASPPSSRLSGRVVAVAATPLDLVLRRANRDSLNMMAECLFLRAAAGAGRPATWAAAAATARKVLLREYRLPPDQFRVADGSGFSRRNRVSPRALTSLLRALHRREVFLRSLAVAGAGGSLRSRLKAPPCRGRILAKTGSLLGVSALSGYVLDRAGQPALTFSILQNGPARAVARRAKRLEDDICRLLVRHVDAAAPHAPDSARRPPRP